MSVALARPILVGLAALLLVGCKSSAPTETITTAPTMQVPQKFLNSHPGLQHAAPTPASKG